METYYLHFKITIPFRLMNTVTSQCNILIMEELSDNFKQYVNSFPLCLLFIQTNVWNQITVYSGLRFLWF